MIVLKIAQDFSPFPAGRYYTDGPFSGQKFREEFLKGPLLSGESIEIHLAGAMGYGSSFLEEAFGGLVRLGLIPADQLKRRIKIIPGEKKYEIYTDLIDGYISKAVFGSDRNKPQPHPVAASA